MCSCVYLVHTSGDLPAVLQYINGLELMGEDRLDLSYKQISEFRHAYIWVREVHISSNVRVDSYYPLQMMLYISLPKFSEVWRMGCDKMSFRSIIF